METRQEALHKLMDFLARRDHSVLELQQKLEQREFSQEDIEWALARAEESHWLTEPQELAERVAGQLDRKYKSHRYIQNYLKQKGLPGTPMDRSLEVKKILQYLSGKVLTGEVLKDEIPSDISYSEKQKITGQLHRRGFDLDLIKEAFNEIG